MSVTGGGGQADSVAPPAPQHRERLPGAEDSAGGHSTLGSLSVQAVALDRPALPGASFLPCETRDVMWVLPPLQGCSVTHMGQLMWKKLKTAAIHKHTRHYCFD